MARYDLVFEGGGAKGSAFVGALEVLQQAGHTHRRLIGTSAGAITATLLAAGYTPQEMLAAVTERLPNGKPRFASFMDPPTANDFTEQEKLNSTTMKALESVHLPGFSNLFGGAVDRLVLKALLASDRYCQLFSFAECGGFFTGAKFLEWFQEKLAAKGIPADVTFETFAARTGADLSLVASDTADVEMLVLNHRTSPDCLVALAVRMSMSIPFVWREVVWQEEWGLYRGRNKTGNIIVDGGVLSNFPIRLIATTDPFIKDVMGDTDPNGAGNLGLLIDENVAVANVADTAQPPALKLQLRTVQRVSRLVDTMTKAQDNILIQNHEHEICRIPAKGYGTTEFEMAEARLEALIESGRSAMTTHLGGRLTSAVTS